MLSKGDKKGIFFTETVAKHLSLGDAGEVHILEWGAADGQGCRALLEESPHVQLTAVEILEEARAPLEEIRAGFGARFNYAICDSFGGLAAGPQFDVILANPPQMPYPQKGLSGISEADLRINYANAHGRELIRAIFHDARAFLRPGGQVFVGAFGFLGVRQPTRFGQVSLLSEFAQAGYQSVSILDSQHFPIRPGGVTERMLPQLKREFPFASYDKGVEVCVLRGISF